MILKNDPFVSGLLENYQAEGEMGAIFYSSGPSRIVVSSPSFHKWKNFLEVPLVLTHTQRISIWMPWCSNKFVVVFMKPYLMNEWYVGLSNLVDSFVGFKMLMEAFCHRELAVLWEDKEIVVSVEYIFFLHITFISIV